MKELQLNAGMEEYLAVSEYINWDHEIVKEKAEELRKNASDEISLVKTIYEFVRDEIPHSWDVQDRRITKSASEVLEQGVGICWAKSNLLAALLRACNIPAGICYQRLTLGEEKGSGLCIHALNAVYIKSLDKWIRLDARGNKEGVDAQFGLEKEQLAFPVRRDWGEVDYTTIYAKPAQKLMKILEEGEDMLCLYSNCLTDTIYDYKKASLDDIDELVRTRSIVLKAANKLPENTDMSEVEKESYKYYERALKTGEHMAVLVYDSGEFIGAGGVSFYQVMPTYHNQSGKKAYIMNMYTASEYRRQGIAYAVLDMLVKEVKKQGIPQIGLEATDMGRPLYEKYGFVNCEAEMELAGE